MKKAHDLVKERYKLYWWGQGGDYVARKAIVKSYKKQIETLGRYLYEMEADLKKDDEDIAYFLELAKLDK